MYVGFVAGALAVFRACSLHCTMFFSTCHRLAAIYFGSALTKLFEHGGCIKAFGDHCDARSDRLRDVTKPHVETIETNQFYAC